MKAGNTYVLLVSIGLLTSAFAQTSTGQDTTKVVYKKPPIQPSPAPEKPIVRPKQPGLDQFQSMNQVIDNNPYGLVRKIDMRYEGLLGTPYFLPDWSEGMIEMNMGKNYTNVPLKFDAFSQNLLLRRPWSNNDSIIVYPNQVIGFILKGSEGQDYYFKRYPQVQTAEVNLRDGYFMVLYEGKNALLKRVSKQFKKADFKDPYSNNVRYDSYNDDFSYYLLKPDKTLVKVKQSKKGLLDALSDKEASIKTFIDKEKLNLKTDDGLARVVQYYDTL